MFIINQPLLKEVKRTVSLINFTFVMTLLALNSFSQSITFTYTGSSQTWVVPACVTSISVTAAGAEGGGNTGGNGAIVTGTIAVTPGQTIQINVGGSGACPGAGFNGGGNGQNAGTTANRSCGGGGASDIRISPYNLANRLIVASGGGGMGGGTTDAVGGNGGCASGQAGTSPFGQGGGAGTQSNGGSAGPPWISSGNPGTAGSLGQGGNGGTDPCYNNSPGGGGGGGYYGGGGGGSDCYSSSPYGGGSGGGGSSLIPAGGGCTSGSNNGPGYVTITYTTGAGTATASNTGAYCVGATIQLNATGGTSYSWTGPNGFTSGLQNPTIPNSTTAHAGTYNVTATGAGCTATASTTVVINPLPAVNAGVDQNVCTGGSVTLSGSGATTYTWDNSVSNGVAFSPPGTTTYTVTGTTAGCTNTDQVVVTVNPLPTIVVNDESICAGGSATLTASGANTYSWSPTTGLSPTSGATVTASPSSTTTYTVSGTTTQGCVSSSPSTVTLLTSAVIDAGPDVSMCSGSSTILSASGGSIYDWDNGLGVGNNVSITPLSTTTYTVTGTNSLGCVGTDAITVTINSIPVVDAGPDQTVCSGTSVTLAGSGAATYSWNLSVNDGVAFTPLATNTYTVTGTATGGCTSTDQVTVTVNPIPVVNAGSDQEICIGAPVTLSGSGANTYSWDNSISDGVAFNPTATTTYTVTGTSLGCTSTDQVIVTVNPLPIVGAGIDQTVCAGTSVTLSGSGASTYSWDNSVVNGASFTPGVGTLTYTVTGTSVQGCTNSDQVDVIVNANPIVNAGTDQMICAAQSVILSGSGANTYSWSGGVTDGTSFYPPATNTYTVTGTSLEGCLGTDQVVVTVNPIPVVFAGNNMTICEGQLVTLNASGANTYNWDNGISNGIAFLPAVGTTTYSVTGTTTSGCTDTDQMDITVEPTPVISFTPDVTAGCAPLTVNFFNTTANSSNCVWTLEDGTVLTGCGTVSNTYTQTGCHNVTLSVTSPTGCTNSFTAVDLICIENDPIASFNASTYVLNEYSMDIDFSNNTIGAINYDWDFGDDSPGSTDLDPSHNYEGAPIGNYDVTLIAYSPLGCVDTARIIIQIQEDLIFYIPNTFTPDGDMFNQTFQPIFTSGFDPYDFTMLIFNRWGEIIFESHNAEIGWDGTYGGELVKEGVYSWKIEFKTSTSDARKMVVGHINMLR